MIVSPKRKSIPAESNTTLIRFPTHLCGMLRYPLLLRYDLRSVLSPQLSVWIFFYPTRIRAWKLLSPPELKGILRDLSGKGSSNFFKALFATLAKVSRGCIAHLNEFNCTPLCSPSCLSTVSFVTHRSVIVFVTTDRILGPVASHASLIVS